MTVERMKIHLRNFSFRLLFIKLIMSKIDVTLDKQILRIYYNLPAKSINSKNSLTIIFSRTSQSSS